jgi:hypothetical protein
LPLGFVADVERELKGIKKPLVYKVLDFYPKGKEVSYAQAEF